MDAVRNLEVKFSFSRKFLEGWKLLVMGFWGNTALFFVKSKHMGHELYALYSCLMIYLMDWFLQPFYWFSHTGFDIPPGQDYYYGNEYDPDYMQDEHGEDRLISMNVSGSSITLALGWGDVGGGSGQNWFISKVIYAELEKLTRNNLISQIWNAFKRFIIRLF